jgi:hypothetical protein
LQSTSSGGLAMLAAMRHARSLVSISATLTKR